VLFMVSPVLSDSVAHEPVTQNFGHPLKSPRMSAGQSPTANYNHALMRAILNDRMPYLSPMMNTKFIKLEDAPAAYKEFDAGSAYKYVIDPHGSVRH
ncbi:hypothetical protein QVL96_24040, partial [Pseudomonas aeruginosa]